MKLYTEENCKIHFNKFIILALLLTVDCWLFDTSGFAIGRIFFAIIALFVTILSVEESFFAVAFCLPFAGVLKIGYSSFTIMPVLYLIVILKLLVKNKIKFDTKKFSAFLILLAMQLMGVALFDATLISVVSFFLSLIFVYSLSEELLSKKWDNGYLFKNMTLFFVGAVCLETVLALQFKDIAYFLAYDKQVALDFSNRFAALNSDPNEYSQLVLMAVGLLIAYFALSEDKRLKVLSVAVGAFLIYNGFFTYSKSFALALAGVFIFALVLYFKNRAKQKGEKLTWLMIPLLIVCAAVVGIIYFYVIQPIFDQRSGSDLLTGRDKVWKGYLSQLISNGLIMAVGTGVSNARELVREININLVPHNFYIEYMVQFGVLGLTSLAFFLGNVLKGIKRCLGGYLILAVIAFLITAFGISANANDTIFFMLLISCVPYQKRVMEDIC